MPRAFVLGSPIAHSLSPVLHRAAYAALGLTDWSYAAHDVGEAGFAAFVAGLGADVRGLSLTMPLKGVAFTVADPVSGRARLAGAINTLVRTETGWAGHNTDIAGIIHALGEAAAFAAGPQQGGGRAGAGLILGAGATARSALIALRALGCERVNACVRDVPKARDSLTGLADGLDVELTVSDWRGWPDLAGGLVISTLPAGGGQRAAQFLDASGRRLDGVRLLDVVYAGWPTPLARAAEAAGAQVVGGLEMLAHQAVDQVELMTGRRPAAQVLLEAGRAAASRQS